MEYPHDPAISLLGVNPKELKPGTYPCIHISMFKVPLITIGGNNPHVYQHVNG